MSNLILTDSDEKKPPLEEFQLQTFPQSLLPAELDEKPGATIEVEVITDVIIGGETEAKAAEAKKRPAKISLAGLGVNREKRLKLWQRIELGLLGVVIAVVWILLALPLIFYHIPEITDGNSTLNGTSPTESAPNGTTPDDGVTLNVIAPNDTDPNTNSTACLRGSTTLYTGECMDVLADLQSCLATNGDVYVSEGLDFTELDTLIGDLKTGLKFLGASPECESAAILFFCLYLFGLCDASGSLHRPSSSDCITISTDTCSREWAIAATQFSLPQCESFPATTDPICEVNITSQDAALNCSSSADCLNPCSKGFYCSGGVCLPRCDQWVEYSQATVIATDAVVVVTASIGLISGIIVLVISCIRWKRMFVFPSVYVVYLTITLVLFALFVLISYVDRNRLYCSSCDFALARSNPTAFCITAAVVFYYVILQVGIWWFSHVLAMFWKIRFPFHAKRFETARYFKYVHITTVILALIVPAIPIIAEFIVGGSKGAFGQIRYPPILCTGLNGDIAFYGIALPVIILLQIGVTMLIIMFWSVHKQHGLFRMKQSKSPFEVSTAERKILIVFCYYVVLGVFAFTSFTLAARNVPHFVQEIVKYFFCEAEPDPENLCPTTFREFSHPELSSTAIALFGLFPVANLIFAIDMREVKRVFSFFKGKFKVFGHEQPSVSAISASTIH